jgi:hypothetical protein
MFLDKKRKRTKNRVLFWKENSKIKKKIQEEEEYIISVIVANKGSKQKQQLG